MRYLKVVKFIVNLLAFVGIVIIIGTIGNSDYCDAVGEYYPIKDIVKPLIIGGSMILPSILMLIFGGKNGE